MKFTPYITVSRLSKKSKKIGQRYANLLNRRNCSGTGIFQRDEGDFLGTTWCNVRLYVKCTYMVRILHYSLTLHTSLFAYAYPIIKKSIEIELIGDPSPMETGIYVRI